jgi:hypothetical protein
MQFRSHLKVLLSAGITIIIEEFYLLECKALQSSISPSVYWWNILPSCSRSNTIQARNQQEAELGSVELDGITSQKVSTLNSHRCENLRSSHSYCLCVETNIGHKS